MRAVYTNPPFHNGQIKLLEKEFLDAAVEMAGSPENLKALFDEARGVHPSGDWFKIHSLARESALFRTGAMSEHRKAFFILEND